MAQVIRHAKSVSPWFIPNNGGSADDFHGISDIKYGVTQASDDVFVVGKEKKCGTDKKIPEAKVSFPQYERGQIQTYLTLANLAAEPGAGIDLADFSSSKTDVVLYERDDFSGNLEQSIWVPKAVIDSIELNIADPEAKIERTVNLSADTKIELQYGNKYLIHKGPIAGTATTTVVSLADPLPVENPNVSGEYALRVDRTRSGETSTLDSSEYSYSPTDLTITGSQVGDVYNVYYSAASFGTAGDPTTVDSGNPCFLKAKNVKVTLNDGTNTVELDLLTSLTITATLNRISESVIGNKEKILKEVQDNSVAIKLTGRVKDSSIAEVFMNKATQNWGINQVDLYNDNVILTVKIYSDDAKTNFVIGYEVSAIAFTDDNSDFAANAFGTLDVSAKSDNMLITTDEGNLTA